MRQEIKYSANLEERCLAPSDQQHLGEWIVAMRGKATTKAVEKNEAAVEMGSGVISPQVASHVKKSTETSLSCSRVQEETQGMKVVLYKERTNGRSQVGGQTRPTPLGGQARPTALGGQARPTALG